MKLFRDIVGWVYTIAFPLVLLVIATPSKDSEYYYCSDVYCGGGSTIVFGIITIILFIRIIDILETLIKSRLKIGEIVKEVKRKKKKYISSLLFVAVMTLLLSETIPSMYDKREAINGQLEVIAKEIHLVCNIKQKCPSSLDGKRFKRVRAGAFLTRNNSSDELEKTLFNKVGVGYNDSGISYKLKPWHGLVVFAYKATNNRFKLSYMADHDDLVTIEISGGIGSDLIFKDSCTACGGRKDIERTLR